MTHTAPPLTLVKVRVLEPPGMPNTIVDGLIREALRNLDITSPTTFSVPYFRHHASTPTEAHQIAVEIQRVMAQHRASSKLHPTLRVCVWICTHQNGEELVDRLAFHDDGHSTIYCDFHAVMALPEEQRRSYSIVYDLLDGANTRHIIHASHPMEKREEPIIMPGNDLNNDTSAEIFRLFAKMDPSRLGYVMSRLGIPEVERPHHPKPAANHSDIHDWAERNGNLHQLREILRGLAPNPR